MTSAERGMGSDEGTETSMSGRWNVQRQGYVLRLCISGMTQRSRDAVVNLKRICDGHLDADYELEVIDLYQQPELAARYNVIATPTLLKEAPLPSRQLFGDLRDTEDVLRKLGIVDRKDER